MTRIGKIARLPRDIRTQLNRRLYDGEPGPALLRWLNAIPEVRTILLRDFDSRKINEQNLSSWRLGGYRDWLAHEETVPQLSDLAADSTELAALSPGRITDQFATILAARYATELARWSGGDGEELRPRLRVLHELTRGIVELRKGDHKAARLEIERTLLDRERERTKEEVFQYFRLWLDPPKPRHSPSAQARPAHSHGPPNYPTTEPPPRRVPS